MNGWLARAPWWALALVSAPFLGAVVILFVRYGDDRSWAQALATGVPSGLFMGTVVGAITTWQLRSERAAAGSASADLWARAERAARRGPLPEDAGERALAHRILVGRLTRMRQSRTSGLVLQSALLVAGTVLALTRSPWWWAAVAVAAGILLSTPALVRRLERRARWLESPDGTT